jgi:hypothetical protein
MPFAKGQSGNPAGRPAGSRNKFTRDMQEALEESGLPLIQRLFELAGEGNTGAIRQCLDRLIGKHRPSSVALPAPDSPNYVVAALSEIHRALGAGEIASDEASRLVDFVGRTARVLASKAAAEIDFADRLARVEEVLVALLKADTARRTQEARPSEAAPATASAQPPAEAAIANNNAETMAPTLAEAAQPVATAPEEAAPIDNNNGNTMGAPDALDEAVRATLPPRHDGVKERLMSSTSPLGLFAGADPRKTAPVVLPEVPLAGAA